MTMAVTSTIGPDHFDAAEFDALIAEHGVPALWRRARACPCVGEDGQPEIACAFCSDLPGYFWDAGVELRVLAPGRQRRDEQQDIGQLMAGMVQITFPSTFTPGHFDRVEFLAATMVINNERLRRGALDPAGRSQERLRIRPSLGVEYCAAIVGDALVAYAEGTDFSVGADGSIAWVPGRGPAAGTRYTLRYHARPTFIIWSPQSRDEGGSKQPYRCQAQRLDFFHRGAVGDGTA